MKNLMIDTARITIQAGNGGDGKVSFLREKYIPRGGPDGGDGGKGGDVYFEADHNMSTLMDFRSRSKYEAQNGEPGGKKVRSGADGEDLIIKVPVGTLVYEIRSGDEILVGDLVEHRQRLLIANGGTGGKGNTSFKGPTNRTPTEYTPGGKGVVKEVKLEIKLIADIGLIGFPNAGKSTLINKLTNSQAKVANYPFTTLSPNLGIWEVKDGSRVVIADIPGLIEGASEGKGLGDDFLRHIERTKILVHIIDPFFAEDTSDSDMSSRAMDLYKSIRGELDKYGSNLSEKPEIIVINKTDITEVNEAFKDISKKFKNVGKEVVGVSAVAGFGLDELEIRVMELMSSFEDVNNGSSFETVEPTKVYTIDNLPNKRIVFRQEKRENTKSLGRAPGKGRGSKKS